MRQIYNSMYSEKGEDVVTMLALRFKQRKADGNAK